MYFKGSPLNSSWCVVGVFNLTSEVVRGQLEAFFDFSSLKEGEFGGVTGNKNCSKSKTIELLYSPLLTSEVTGGR